MALEHYYSAMELCCPGDPELGTLHSNCCHCCLTMDDRMPDELQLPAAAALRAGYHTNTAYINII